MFALVCVCHCSVCRCSFWFVNVCDGVCVCVLLVTRLLALILIRVFGLGRALFLFWHVLSALGGG